MNDKSESVDNTCGCITEEVIKRIVRKSNYDEDIFLEHYRVFKASDKMLGFLSDYWKLQIQIRNSKNEYKLLCYFVKAVSKTNAAKANMVKEMNLFEKETTFYTVIKSKLHTPGINAWSPVLIESLNDAMVFEDLNELQYKTRNKLEAFDEEHTLLALETLARFHASSINYEEKRSKQFGKRYYISDDHKNDLTKGGYQISDPWFIQCMNGALEAVKMFSKYNNNKEVINLVEKRWKNVWERALRLADSSSKYRNVICHRDLWNNNMLFRYKKVGTIAIPVDCLLVDFQAVRSQPPAGDVLLLLHCNLDHIFREQNALKYLIYYYTQLKNILKSNGVSMEEILSQQDFLNSCGEQKLWGLIVSACLVPQFWLDDDLTSKNFCDTSNFQEIMTKDKASFIKKMIEGSEDYKSKVMQIFEEIVQQYCL